MAPAWAGSRVWQSLKGDVVGPKRWRSVEPPGGWLSETRGAQPDPASRARLWLRSVDNCRLIQIDQPSRGLFANSSQSASCALVTFG